MLDGISLRLKVRINQGKFFGDKVGVFVGEVNGASGGDLDGDSVGGGGGLQVGKMEPVKLS